MEHKIELANHDEFCKNLKNIAIKLMVDPQDALIVAKVENNDGLFVVTPEIIHPIEEQEYRNHGYYVLCEWSENDEAYDECNIDIPKLDEWAEREAYRLIDDATRQLCTRAGNHGQKELLFSA